MSSAADGLPLDRSGPAPFATTHWSLVVAARDRATPHAREALATLCRQYWYPLYAFVRRQGHSAEEAQDLTQEFFARLLEKDYLASVERKRGRFRSFLLAACKHFLANQRDHRRARKRGGGLGHLSLDFVAADRRYHREPAHNLTPEKLFELRWALALLDRVLGRVRAEARDAKSAAAFELLKPFLEGNKSGSRYAEVAARLGTTEGAVKVAVHRLRKRYRELLHEEIASTVANPDLVEDEIRALFAALG